MEMTMSLPDAGHLVHDGIKQLKPYVPGKPLEELERECGITNAIKMASNENPLGPSPRALEALGAAIRSIHRYPDAASHALRHALSEKMGVLPECILPANGSNEILELSAKAFLRPGDEALIPAPTFSLYATFTQVMNAVPITVPLKDFAIDLDMVLSRVNEKTRMIFINNPNNPTGTVITRSAFERFLSALPENVIVILDEAYREFVTTEDTPHGEDYLGGPAWVITMRTFSKIYGLAGLRIGYGLAAQGIIGLLNKIRQPFNVNLLAQIAATAALADEEHVARTQRVVSEGLQFFYRELDALGISYIPTQSNYLMIQVNRLADEIYQAMLRRGVIIRPLTSFGYPYSIRINAGTPDENRRCLSSLKDVLARGATRE